MKNTEDTKQQNPEEIIIDRESTNLMQEKIKERLSPFENQVLRAYLEGKDYHQIARQMEKSPKSIDNALQRIRNKIHDLMETL